MKSSSEKKTHLELVESLLPHFPVLVLNHLAQVLVQLTCKSKTTRYKNLGQPNSYLQLHFKTFYLKTEECKVNLAYEFLFNLEPKEVNFEKSLLAKKLSS
jgi:hypothetical protein